MNVTIRKKKHWRLVFRRVMTWYDELVSVDGLVGAISYERALGESKSIGSAHGVPHITPSDFIADVELAAKSALDHRQWTFFKAVYRDKNPNAENELGACFTNAEFTAFKHEIHERVGCALVDRHIYPVGTYFRQRTYR